MIWERSIFGWKKLQNSSKFGGGKTMEPIDEKISQPSSDWKKKLKEHWYAKALSPWRYVKEKLKSLVEQSLNPEGLKRKTK